jgi:glutamate synthase domain-containing protein 3
MADSALLKSLIENHATYTGSERAKAILADWNGWLPKFTRVMPGEYRRALGELAAKRNVDANPAKQLAAA